MGRIRTVKPQMLKHEDLSQLKAEVHLLAVGLLCYSDDEGYFNANPVLVKAEVFPLREHSVSTHAMLIELSNIGYLRLGSTPDGKRYGHVINFLEHQRINRPTPSKLKLLPIVWDVAVTAHPQITEVSLPEGNKEGKGREGEAPPPVPNFDIEQATPEDLPIEALAKGMIEILGIPSNKPILEAVSQAIITKAKQAGETFAWAHDHIRGRAREIQSSDPPTNWLWWFRDGRYDATKRKTVAQKNAEWAARQGAVV